MAVKIGFESYSVCIFINNLFILHFLPNTLNIDEGNTYRDKVLPLGVAILPPEQLILHRVDFPVPEGGVDGTFPLRVGRAVFPGVMAGGVAVAADELFDLIPQHPCRRGIDEGVIPLVIEPEDALAGGIEDQRIPLAELPEVR
mgnify:CR=1 FL=1